MNTSTLMQMESAVFAEFERVETRRKAVQHREELLAETARAAEDECAEGLLSEEEANRFMELPAIARRMHDRLEVRAEALRNAFKALEEARELAQFARSDRQKSAFMARMRRG
jgi:hypothetical protein